MKTLYQNPKGFSTAPFHATSKPMFFASTQAVPLWASMPFALLLTLIAIMPFLNKHFWERRYPHVSALLGLLVVVGYIFILHATERLAHTALEYFSFMAIMAALFTVSGGIHIRVKGESTPLKNVLFLGVGAVLANLIGTTGASMLLIRPWIRMNKYRITEFHTVFFIFIVSNAGGCLTPIGDPPLFLGYLKGIPFFWTLQHLWPAWLMANALLLAIFYILDKKNQSRIPSNIVEKESAYETFHISGKRNIIFLAVILAAVFMPTPLREILMLAAAAASYFTTPKQIHESNHFDFHPVKEVGWLFAGIFATMMPALDYLQTNAGSLGINSPLAYYWFSGVLSSFLDNAPTYLTFLTVSASQHSIPLEQLAPSAGIYLGVAGRELAAISLGAVFFGAMTYIGNGPNFMVKSIAEQQSVGVPSFFGYIFRFSIPFLLPILALAGWLFLH